MGTRLNVFRFPMGEFVQRHLAALALREEHDLVPMPPVAVTAVLLLHLFGLAAFWRYYHQPLWLALPTLAIFLIFPFFTWRSRRVLAVETLAPLFFLYAILMARVITVRVLLANEPYQDEASFADPRFIAFQVEATAAAVLGYVAIIQTARLSSPEWRTRALVALCAVLGGAALAWFGVETIAHRTRGVTATDPYAYAQMAVDLTTRGTLLHTFPLFRYVVNANISWYPVEHIGYRLFDNLTGSVATVWPAGGSFLLALGYRLLGEEGLYIVTPLASLAALVALGLLAWEYLSGRGVVERAAVAAIAVALLATSWEQVDRSIVPLVDTQAQLFSMLAIFFALRATNRTVESQSFNQRGIHLLAVMSGLALGAAYFVRHTQLLMVVPLVLAVTPLPRGRQIQFLFIAAIASLVVALPDLWYHHQHFGGWLTPESQEMALFSASSFIPSAAALSTRFLAGNEFGYLVLFLLYGTYRAAREDGARFPILAVWVLLLTAFHLLYTAVKIRDLLPEFPAAMLLTANGMVALARDVCRWVGSAPQLSFRRVAGDAVVALVIFIALLLPAMRDRLTILRPFQPVKVTFGYVTDAQRTSFKQIAALTPSNAIIGSTMNDGAVDLYTGRLTFRPGAWSEAECERFIQIAREQNRPVYLLDDGAETSAARHYLGTQYTLHRIAVLDVPLFGDVDDTPGALWKIE